MKIKQILISLPLIAALISCAQVKTPPTEIIKTNQIETSPIVENDISAPDAIDLLVDEDSAKNAITNVKSTLAHKHGKHYRHHGRNGNNSHARFLANSTFNFSYNGDIVGITMAFHNYDSSITIYPSTGKVKYQNINIDLTNTNIASLIDYVNNATQGRVKLVYYKKHNALRLVYAANLSVARDALKQSQIWQDGGTPSPVLSHDGIVLFPYGQYEPKITCQPLQLCDIQLQAGETVKGVMIGDSVRWNEGDGSVPVVYSGNDVKPVPHIVLKPTYAGLNTTLLVTTDKRTYYMKLFSADNANLSRVGFYYPSEQIQQLEDKRVLAKAHDDEVLSDGALPNIDPRNMHFNYKVSGDTDAPFNPVQVFDDGTHVYIQMSDSVRTNELPAFYVLGTDGKTLELVNFNYKKPFYIVNKLFNEGVLVLGLDGNKQKITITKK